MNLSRLGAGGVRESLHSAFLGGCRLPGRVTNYGTPVYDRDWDVLIVLDACRKDLFESVVTDDGRFASNDEIYSVASASLRWMARTFRDECADKIGQTAYVTGNMKSSKELPGHDGETLHDKPFRVFDEVWKYAWHDEVDTILPKALTNRAIRVHRNEEPDRLIVHYMQPHAPFIPPRLPVNPDEQSTFEDVRGVSKEGDLEMRGKASDYSTPWERLRRGEVDYDTVWEGYQDNLRYVLSSVQTLLSNIDADKAVITSDHGNLLGEFGLYGHPLYVLHPKLREVPWAVTTASNTEEYEPPSYDRESETGPSVGEKLRLLGYK